MVSEMRRSAEVTVGDTERVVSVVGGSVLTMYGLMRRSWLLRVPLMLGGGYLLYRGVSGAAPAEKALGIRTTRQDRRTGIRVVRTTTIAKPREEIYHYWRDIENLPRIMQHLCTVQPMGEVAGAPRSHWVARGPMGASLAWDAEIVEDREGELIAWRSLPGSQVENQGVVMFRDAPGNRGTEVQVRLEYIPPGGVASAAIATLLGDDPDAAVHEDLRRFKQLMETGEVATTFGQSSGRIGEVERQREMLGPARRKRERVLEPM